MKNKSLILGLILIAIVAGVIYVSAPRMVHYNSDTLGIEFTYEKNMQSDLRFGRTSIEEEGARIYLYPNDPDYSGMTAEDVASLFSIEVYSKDPSESLETAVRELLPAQGKCSVAPVDPDDAGFPRIWDYAIVVVTPSDAISVPEEGMNVADFAEARYQLCPTDYLLARGNGRFFMMNNQVPNKFIFVDSDEATLSWASSIRINQ